MNDGFFPGRRSWSICLILVGTLLVVMSCHNLSLQAPRSSPCERSWQSLLPVTEKQIARLYIAGRILPVSRKLR
jgi:hypothetical protein